MSFLRTFAPWIAYAVASAVVDWRLGAVLALAVATAELVRQRRVHRRADALTVATAAFFAGLAVVSLADPTAALHRFTPALALGLLGVVALGSLARGAPFTLAIARRSTPPELWDHPGFLAANVAITRVWAVSFLITAAACLVVLAVDPEATALWVGAQVIGFAVPLAYTDARRRRARAASAAVLAAGPSDRA
ncbi:MAG: hypothetical protein KDB35_05445 [Acidimicrobiales bacterium]|nr:hypothetical protein [Acidimicrobiales bacterium]MCB1016608.1 hypothetical protein [Acidimicrobiales bacterium]